MSLNVLLETAARIVYNAKPEPLSAFTDRKLTAKEEADVMADLAEQRAANSPTIRRALAGILVVTALLCGLILWLTH